MSLNWGHKTAGIAAVAAVVVVTSLAIMSVTAPARPSYGVFDNPHGGYTATTDSCATCHRSHTGQNRNLLKNAAPQSMLCFSCHDGTGATYNVSAQYTDVNVPANNPATSSYYSHPATTASSHTAAQNLEFAGVLNRHSECSDCHNPHTANSGAPAQTGSGWTASGSLSSISGVTAAVTWVNPATYEYELCLKCHSRYTTLLSSTTPTYNKTDKAAELDPTTASYHPVEAAGKNTTTEMQNSLNGGTLWRLTTSSTVRCTMCHGNYRLVGNPPVLNSPATNARLAPHTSQYRSLLIANYRDRVLKPTNEAYAAGDFSLCYLCHAAAPFTDTSGNTRTDTNFRFHGFHLGNIANQGSGGTDINVLGAGQGRAICAECHFEVHGTKLAPWAANQNYSRGVNFAPNIGPRSGQTAPIWNAANRTCALICHGKDHNNLNY